MPSPRSPNRIGEMRYMNFRNADLAIVAKAGGGQGSATQLAAGVNVIGTVASAGDSVKLPKVLARPEGVLSAVGAGLFTPVIVWNNGANSLQLFGANPDTVMGIATATGLVVPAGTVLMCVPESLASGVGDWTVGGAGLGTIGQVSQFNAINTASPATLTGAQFAGSQDVFINMTTNLGAGGTLNTPTAAQIIAAIPNARVGMTYNLRIINSSAGNFAWTLTAGSNVTLTGTMTIAQNTFRDFVVSVTGANAVTVQSVGTGTTS